MEKAHTGTNIKQCFSCQELNHIAQQCKNKTQCVRCREEHSHKIYDKEKHIPKYANCEKKKKERGEYLKGNMIRQRRATSHSSRKRCACSLNERDVPLPSHDFSIPGYDIIRGDRSQGKGGGVALLFERPIVYNETITSLSPEQAQNNEFVIARVKFSSNYSIILMSVYCPPGVTHSPQLFQEALLKEKSAIIMGDFNAKQSSFNNKTTNLVSGITLNNITEQLDLVLLNHDEPTHYSASHNSVDILDLYFVTPDLTGKVTQFAVCPDVGHLPILTSFNLEAQAALRKPKYDYKTANWRAFKLSTPNQSNTTTSCDPKPSTIGQRAILLAQILLTAREKSINLKGD